MTTYSPTFTQPVIGNYAEDKAFIIAVGATDGYVMENELNELQWILSDQRAKAMSELFSSGSFAKGADSVANGTLTLAQRDLLVKGHMVHMIGKATDSGNVIVPLPTAPTTGTRTDLVYLVMYLNEVNYQSTVYKNGYMQGDTLTNDILDSRVGAETMRRVQKQWTVKTASGVSTLTDASLGYAATSWDNNLYTKSNASTVDGVEYAIPLYQANRTAGSPDTLTDVAYYVKGYKTVGQAGGLATLDGNGHVPAAQITAANLPIATGTAAGIVIAGSGVSIDGSGKISVSTSTINAATLSSAGNTFSGDQILQKNTPALSFYDTSTNGLSWRLIANGTNGFQLQTYTNSAWVVRATFSATGDITASSFNSYPTSTSATAGTIAVRNADGSLTASVNANLIFDPSFALKAWSNIGVAGFNALFDGNGSYLSNKTSPSGSVAVNGATFSVTPGDQLMFSADMNASGTTAGLVQAKVYFYDGSNNVLSNITLSATNGTGWTRYSTPSPITVPANAVTARATAELVNATNTNAGWRRYKLEKSQIVTTYSDDNTLNTIQYSSNLPLAQVLSGGNKVQSGTVNLPALTANVQGSAAVTFPTQFSGTPIVTLTVRNVQQPPAYITLETGNSATTNGFTAYATSGASQSYLQVDWTAVGS